MDSNRFHAIYLFSFEAFIFKERRNQIIKIKKAGKLVKLEGAATIHCTSKLEGEMVSLLLLCYSPLLPLLPSPPHSCLPCSPALCPTRALLVLWPPLERVRLTWPVKMAKPASAHFPPPGLKLPLLPMNGMVGVLLGGSQCSGRKTLSWNCFRCRGGFFEQAGVPPV